jgi:hypothetical protein
METGPLAVWLWNELHDRGLPVICIDARHANAALKVRPNKTDRNDAAGLAQIIRTGWFKQVRINLAAATNFDHFWRPARFSCGHVCRLKTRSGVFYARSGFCSVRQPADLQGAQIKLLLASLMHRR